MDIYNSYIAFLIFSINNLFQKKTLKTQILYIDAANLKDYEIIIMSFYINLTPGTYTVYANNSLICVNALTYIKQEELLDLKFKTQQLLKKI